ncbi:unnamed protein product, partial [marine sediment metagenome]
HMTVAAELVPWPSVVAGSGRGMYAFWLLTATPADKKARELYDAAQARLCSLFAAIGADPRARDVCRVLRPPDSFHSVAENRVIWIPTMRGSHKVLAYTLADLHARIHEPIPAGALAKLGQAVHPRPRTSSAKALPGPWVKRGTPLAPGSVLADISIPTAASGQRYSPSARIRDLGRLAESRGGIGQGHRHFFLFRMAQCLACLG